MEVDVKYILSMIGDYSVWQKMTPADQQAFDKKITAFNEELRKADAWVSGEGLGAPEESTTVRFNDGKPAVEKGPFYRSRDQLGGYWLIEADDVQEAVSWAKKVPLTEGAIEVRPLVG